MRKLYCHLDPPPVSMFTPVLLPLGPWPTARRHGRCAGGCRRTMRLRESAPVADHPVLQVAEVSHSSAAGSGRRAAIRGHGSTACDHACDLGERPTPRSAGQSWHSAVASTKRASRRFALVRPQKTSPELVVRGGSNYDLPPFQWLDGGDWAGQGRKVHRGRRSMSVSEDQGYGARCQWAGSHAGGATRRSRTASGIRRNVHGQRQQARPRSKERSTTV